MQKSFLIFLVDDDEDDQEIFTLAAKQLSLSIDCLFANDGVYALEKIIQDPSFLPDIIFMDINMPRMNGLQCLAELKKLPHINHVPVYMYSTSDDKSIVQQCLQNGAAGFLKKEINIEDLHKKLLQIITQLKVVF